MLGHSTGTLRALAVATVGAPDVRGRVRVSCYYYPNARVGVALAAPAALAIIGGVLRYTVSPVSGRLFLTRTMEAMFAPAHVPDNFFEFVARQMVLRPMQIRAAAEDGAFTIRVAAQLSARYPDLKMPGSIFGGADDTVIDPQSNSVWLHVAIAHSTLVRVPGAGHVHYPIAG